MADGNALDDDLDEDSIEFETTVDGASGFILPQHGFSTPMQREWAMDVTKNVRNLIRENRILRSQAQAALAAADRVGNSLAEVTMTESEAEEVEPIQPPSAPVIESRLGTFTVTWDGSTAEGVAMSSQLDHIEVFSVKTADLPTDPDFDLVQTYSEGVPTGDPDGPIEQNDDPLTPVDKTTWPPISVGTIYSTTATAAVVLADLEYNVEYTVWFLAVDKAGVRTTASPRTTASVQPLVNTDIIGRVIEGANVELGSLNEELFDARFQGKLDDLEASAQNNSVLVRNYSFESDDGWVGVTSSGMEMPFDREEISDAPSGSWVLSAMQELTSGFFYSAAAQVVPVVAGNQYRLRWYSRLVNTGSDYAGAVAGVYTGDIATPTESWTVRATTVLGPAEANLGWVERTLEFAVEESWGDEVILMFTTTKNGAGKSQADRVILDNLSVPTAVGGNLFSELDPHEDGTSVGQIWYKRNTAGEILGMWEWDGSDWNALEMNDSVIGNLSAGKITTGFLDADRLEANSIHGNKIIADTIAGDRIVGDSITGDKIVGNTITGDKIAALTIESGKIASNAITADKIEAGAVTATKMAADFYFGREFYGGKFEGGAFYLPSLGDTRDVNCTNATGWSSTGGTVVAVSTPAPAYIRAPIGTITASFPTMSLTGADGAGIVARVRFTPGASGADHCFVQAKLPSVLYPEPVRVDAGDWRDISVAVRTTPLTSSASSVTLEASLPSGFSGGTLDIQSLTVGQDDASKGHVSISRDTQGQAEVFVGGALRLGWSGGMVSTDASLGVGVQGLQIASSNFVTIGSDFKTLGRAEAPGNTFALKSQLNAWSPIAGTHAWVTAENREYVRVGSTWKAVPDTQGDTGWINLTMSGQGLVVQSQPRARVIGGIVYFQGTLSSSTLTGGYTTVGNLPSTVPKPSGANAVADATMNSPAKVSFRITTGGALQLFRSEVSGSWINLSTMFYPVD